jgi:hypothetical protein
MGDFHPYYNQTDILISPPVAGSHATATTKELVAAVAGKKAKVHSLTFSTLVDTACIVQLTDGSGGDVLYEIELQSSIVPGVALSNNQVKYFQTTAGNALHLKLSAAQKVTYSLTVVQGD